MPVPVTDISILATLPGNIPGGHPTWGIICPLDEDSNESKRLSQQVELGLCLHLALSRRCPAVEVKEKRHRGLDGAMRRCHVLNILYMKTIDVCTIDRVVGT